MLVSPSTVEYTNMVIYIERKFVENIMNGAILSEWANLFFLPEYFPVAASW